MLRAAFEGFLECRQVRDWLKRRSRLTLRLDYSVELRFSVVAAAGHRANLPGLRLDRDQAGLQLLFLFLAPQRRMLRLQPLEVVADRLVALALHVHVERSKDAQALSRQHRRRI